MKFAVPGIICQKCGKTALRKGVSQKYCPECSEIADLKRKSAWGKNNPPSPEKVTKWKRKREERLRLIAQDKNGLHTTSMVAWEPSKPIALGWIVRVSVPFDYAYSKNAIWSLRKHGHVYLRGQTRKMRETLILAVRNAIGANIKAVTRKVWLDILVQKPNHRGDAVNVLETICDSVKEAIKVDDRWFSIRRLDWEIVKQNPMLIVGIGQENDIPQRVCSYCGLVKDLVENFPILKHGLDGYGRVCKPCGRYDEQARRTVGR